MKAGTLLQLGRVSNLPTVWSNVFAAHVVAQASTGSSLTWAPLTCCLLSGTLLYEGGMLLNDAYDAEIDRIERPERPIPSGRAARRTVSTLGFGLLAAGVLIPLAFWILDWARVGALWAALLTSTCVWAYDRFHKGISWAPLLMGACRAGLYGMAALAVTDHPPFDLAVSAVALLLYVVGLTHVARFETGTTVQRAWLLGSLCAPPLSLAFVDVESMSGALPFLALEVGWIAVCLLRLRRGGRGSIGATVVALIAGISLVDAVLVATTGDVVLAVAPVVAFVTTLLLQRWVRGT